MTKKLKKSTECFRCDGTGLLCNFCGESSAVHCDCSVEGEEDFFECEDCGGTGK
jgi:hypothetical protein